MQRMAYQAVTANLNQEGDPAGVARGRRPRRAGAGDGGRHRLGDVAGEPGGRQRGRRQRPAARLVVQALRAGRRARAGHLGQVVLPVAVDGHHPGRRQRRTRGRSTTTTTRATATSTSSRPPRCRPTRSTPSSSTRSGPQAVADLATRMGITAELNPVHSLVLGGSEVSVLDMADAYSTFSRGGEQVDPIIVTRIEDRDGNVLQTFGPAARAGDRRGHRPDGQLRPEPGDRGRHRHRRPHQPAGRRQDGHHRGLPRRLVRGLHVLADRGGVGRATTSPTTTARPRFMTDVRGGEVTGRLDPGRHLAHLHGDGDRFATSPVP